MSKDRYGLYPATLTYAGPTTLDIQQISRVGIRPSAKKDILIPSGSIDPAAVILISADPAVEFETDDLATILAAVSPTAGLACTGALFQLQKRADGGTWAGGSTNLAVSSTKGFCYPKTLRSGRADEEGGAKLALQYAALYDGTTTGVPALPTPPLSFLTSQALVSTPAFNARFYLGPVYSNAVLAPTFTDWDLDFGIKYDTKILDGDLWAAVGSITGRRPKVTFNVLDGATANAVAASLFNAGLPGVLALYLRQGAPGGARVSDATASHLKLSLATGAANIDNIDVQGQDDGTFKVVADATGTIAISTASAIP